MISRSTFVFALALLIGSQFLSTSVAQLDSDRQSVPSDGDNQTEDELWLSYAGAKDSNDEGALPGQGKHVVLIAADQEYRSEQSMPMLARILSSHYGFDCTVLFSVNEKGLVDPTIPAPLKEKGEKHRIPGLEKLKSADCLVLLSRFMQLSETDLKHFHDYFDSGKPIIALRTANHGFYGDMGYRKGEKRVPLRELLGGAFMGHYGGWHREATRGIVFDANKAHPIVRGVTDIFGPSDVYRCHNDKSPLPASAKVLVLGQPLKTLDPDAEPNPEKPPMPIAWIKTWTGNAGKVSRIFHFTMGSARDFRSEGVRRLTINAVFWGLKMGDAIKADSSVEIIGRYRPLKSGFNYEKLGVEPKPVSAYK